MSAPAPSGHAALLIGGPADLRGEIDRRLRRDFGVFVAHHWEAGKTRAHVNANAIPADVERVIVLYEISGHDAHDKAKTLAKDRGIPLALISRKWSIARQQLVAAGFQPLPAAPATGDAEDLTEVASEEHMTKLTPESQPALPLPQDVLEALKILRETMRENSVTKLWVEFKTGTSGPLSVSFEVMRPVAGAVEV